MSEEIKTSDYETVWFEHEDVLNSDIAKAYALCADDADGLERVVRLKRVFAIGFSLISRRWATYFDGDHFFGNIDHAVFANSYPFFCKHEFTENDIDETVALLVALRNATVHLHASISDVSFRVPQKLADAFECIAVERFGDPETFTINVSGGIKRAYRWRAGGDITVFGMCLLMLCFLRQHERETLLNYLCGMDRAYKGKVIRVLSLAQTAETAELAMLPALNDDWETGNPVSIMQAKVYERLILQDLVYLSLESEKIILGEKDLIRNSTGYKSFSYILRRAELPQDVITTLNDLRIIVTHGYALGTLYRHRYVNLTRLTEAMIELYDYFCAEPCYAAIAALIKDFCGRVIANKYLGFYINDMFAKKGIGKKLPEGCFAGTRRGGEKLLEVWYKNQYTVTPHVEKLIFDKFGTDIKLLPPTADIKAQMTEAFGKPYVDMNDIGRFKLDEYVFFAEYSSVTVGGHPALRSHVEVERSTDQEMRIENKTGEVAFTDWRERQWMSDCPYGEITVFTAEYETADGKTLSAEREGIYFPRRKYE